MGSGTILIRAVTKHGVKNFEKEILFVFDTAVEMFDKERELVNEEFISQTSNYNIKIGGSGGFDYINATKTDNEKKYHASIGYKSNIAIMTDHEKNVRGGNRSVELQSGIHDPANGGYERWNLIGRLAALSDEAKINRKATFKKIKHQQGSRNSQYGTCWIYHVTLKKNKRIIKTDIDQWIDKGWAKGRKINFV